MKALVKIDYLTKEEYLSLNEMLTSNNEALFIHENSVAIEIGDAPKESFVGRVAYPNCFAYKYDDGTTIYRLYTNKNHYMLKVLKKKKPLRLMSMGVDCARGRNTKIVSNRGIHFFFVVYLK